MNAWLLTYVVNALWQAPLVFVAAWLAVRLLQSFGSRTELRLWTAALGTQVLLPGVSAHLFAWLQLAWLYRSRSVLTAITIRQGPALIHSGWHLSSAFAWTLIIGYLTFLLYRAVCLVNAYFDTLRLRRSTRTCTLTPDAARLWAECQKHFHLPPTQLAECRSGSEGFRTPVTLGLRNPHILFPAGLLSSLAPEELQALFAHEAAHIARHDFARNLLLQVLALPIAFLPTTRFTLLRLTASREMVCDALAAEAMSQPAADGRDLYARSLLRLAAALLRADAGTVPQPFALGLFEASTLERRIMSLTHNVPRLPLLRRTLVVAATLIIALGTCASAVALFFFFFIRGAP